MLKKKFIQMTSVLVLSVLLTACGVPPVYHLQSELPTAKLGFYKNKTFSLFGGGAQLMLFQDPKTCQQLVRAPRSTFNHGKPMDINANQLATLLIEHDLFASTKPGRNQNVFAVSFTPKNKHFYRIKFTDSKRSFGGATTRLSIIDSNIKKPVPLIERKFKINRGFSATKIACTDHYSSTMPRKLFIQRSLDRF